VEGLINRCLLQMANSAPGVSTENRRVDTGRNWEENRMTTAANRLPTESIHLRWATPVRSRCAEGPP